MEEERNDKKFCSAIVVAAGAGKRFGGDVPKQFRDLCGKPVLYYSVKTLCDSPLIDEVILVTSEEWIAFCTDEIVKKYSLDKVQAIVVGGAERHDSVQAGLMVVDISADYVFVHDGARPLLSEEIIARGYETVCRFGTAVAAIPSTDTVKIADAAGVVLSTPDRRSVWRIQTPQIFAYQLLLQAYFSLTEADKDGLTDDAMLIEKKTDTPVHLFEGSEDNFKITREQDLQTASARIGERCGSAEMDSEA